MRSGWPQHLLSVRPETSPLCRTTETALETSPADKLLFIGQDAFETGPASAMRARMNCGCRGSHGRRWPSAAATPIARVRASALRSTRAVGADPADARLTDKLGRIGQCTTANWLDRISDSNRFRWDSTEECGGTAGH